MGSIVFKNNKYNYCAYHLLLIYFLGSQFIVQAQTIHFSQAYGAHLTLNPANTGRFNGDWRAVGMFRNQGIQLADDYQTSYFSFEKPFYYRSEKINTGIFYSRDNSAGGTFPVDRLNISVGTGIWLSHNSTLNAGIQAAYVHKQVRWDGITFPDQYNRDTGGFDPTMPTGDLKETTGTSFADLGFGLLYSKLINKSMFGIGYSLQQINRPSEKFFNIPRTLPFKHIFHAKADININQQLFLIPSGVYINQQNNNAFLAGVNLGYILKEWEGVSNSVIGGLHIRNAAFFNIRSLIYSAGFTWQYYSLMLSYDSPISGSGMTSYNSSAFEITLGFRLPSTEIKYKTIPCERY